MSEEESSKAPYERHPVAVASVILLLVFGSIYAGAVYFNYAPNVLTILLNPVVGITIGVVFLLVIGIGGLLWLKNSGKFGGGQIADQLTKREADKVATRWHRNRGFLAMRTPLDGVDYVQSGSSEEDDHARIYEKVIQPKTDSNRKCILINLEQSVSVDVESGQSIDQAIMSMNDAVFFSEDAVRNFHDAREDYKEKLAGSSPGETVIEEKPDGSVIRRNVSERTIQSADKNQENETIETQS
jgi:hypothetical protein